MAQVPQELLDAIVGQVQDLQSLKNCALSGSVLRRTSQRILLDSLVLDSDRNMLHTSTAALTLLTESPHVARYVTRLSVRLLPGIPYHQILGDVLSKLTRVRRCTIGGQKLLCRWNDPRLSSVIPVVVDFIQRQDLVELQLLLLDLTPSTLARLVSIAPAISLKYVHLEHKSFMAGASIDSMGETIRIPSRTQQLQLLFLSDTNQIRNALSQPIFASCTENVRKLGLPVVEGYESTITAAARGLEHIRFERVGAFPPCVPVLFFSFTPFISPAAGPCVSSLPPLPSLRSVDLKVHACDPHVPWLLGSLASILTSCPATVEEISITCTVAYAIFRYPYFTPEAMNTLHETLIKHDPLPRIRWRLGYRWRDSHISTVTARDFERFLHVGLPAVYKGKLIVERCWVGGDLGQWSVQW